MRLLRLQIRHFGPLATLDTDEEAELPPLVAVLGANEAGKSTLHQAVVALLYGFYPASRDRHPLAPWSGESPEVRGWIRTGEGETLQVHRRLLSSPDGRLMQDERVEELRNRELPQVEHVGMNVFEQVYAVTLADLAGLQEEGWQAVQDRLVVGMGAADLRPPREAAEELEARAGSLWRSNRRGNQRYRTLQQELHEALELRREAEARDQELRKLVREVEEREAELERLRSRRDQLELERARIARLQPVRRSLREIDRLTKLTGPPDELAGLPPDPRDELARLEETLAEETARLENLEAELAELEERADGPDPQIRALLDRHADLQALAHRAPVLRERATERGRLEAELTRLDRRITAAAAPLLDEDAGPPDPSRLESLPLPELRRTLADAHRAEDEARRLEDERAALHPAESPDKATVPGWIPWLGAAAGGLLLVLGFWAGVSGRLPLVAAGALAAVGLALVLGAAWKAAGIRARREWVRGSARRREEADQRLRQRTRQLEDRARDLRRRARELREGLPLRDQVISSSGEELAGELERLRDLAADREERRGRLAEMEADEGQLADAVAEVRRELAGLRDLPSEPEVALPELARRLDEARRRRDAAEEAEDQARRVRKAEESSRARVEDLRQRRTALEDHILSAGGTDEISTALERVEERLEARARLRLERERLARERDDVDRDRRELEEARRQGEAWLDDPHALETLDRHRERLLAELEEVAEEVKELRVREARIADGEPAHEAEGRVQAIRQEMEEVARVRDRYFAMARLIRTAERRFRDEHQPDLLKRAGEHLRRITGGRYRRVLLSETLDPSPFVLDADHLPAPIPPASPISTGTREQAYLALRLAIVDHLDRGHDPLPLFLDEVLVNWDPERRDQGLDLLSRVAETRQVFLFTCHPDLAEEVRGQGGMVVRLPAP